MKIRYTGLEPVMELPIPGACLTFPRMKWLDPAQLAEEALVPAVHVEIAVRGLGPDWETDDTKPAKRPKRPPKAEPEHAPDLPVTGHE